MRAELRPESGGAPIPIMRDITVIGRREYCDIQIDDPSLSKRHCVLVKTDGLLIVRDLATTNGTKVKGQLVRWAALLPEDRLTLGKVRFRVYLGPEATRSVQSPAKRPAEVIAESLRPGPAESQAKSKVRAAVDDDLDWLDGLSSLNLSEEIIELE